MERIFVQHHQLGGIDISELGSGLFLSSDCCTVGHIILLYPPAIHDIVPVARFSLRSYFEKKLKFWGERDTAPKPELGYLIGRPVNPEKSCHGSRLSESCMELPRYWDCWFQDIAECSCAGGETHTLASELFAMTGELE